MSDSEAPEIVSAANSIIQDLLPAKSKRQYETAYGQFMVWRKERNAMKLSENVLLAYFGEKAKSVKGSTLWALYSMLKSTCNIKENVDIGKYLKLISFLKKQMVGYRPKKSKVLTNNDIFDFMNKAPDDTYLLTKVLLIFGISGACRRDELVKMAVENVNDKGSVLIINIPASKTDKPRVFTITNPEYIEVYRRYVALRPLYSDTSRLFLNYQKGKCTSQAVGINKIGSAPCQIAKFLKLENPELYTGHCFRRSSATLLANTGADISMLKRHGGWKSGTVAEGYVEDSIENKIDVSNRISSVSNSKSFTTSRSSSSHVVSSSDVAVSSSGFNITNCSSCTFNIYYNNKE